MKPLHIVGAQDSGLPQAEVVDRQKLERWPETAKVEVWVCARSAAPGLDEVLAALQDAGASPLVAVAAPGEGLATARNEALVRCRAPVIAFVDDDVLVARGWLDALEDAWVRPDAAARACLGGPLVAGFAGRRPGWLGDPLLPALGIDPGLPSAGADADAVEPIAVEALRRTFHGGNVSFRTAALRAIGGFWPARGRAGQRDWYCEEHHAQRELARVGWQAGWVPQAIAERRLRADELSARSIVLARARTGMRSTAVDVRRPAAVAARTAAVSVAGAAVAAVRGDRAKLVERAARGAENVGVLIGPLSSHRDLQPTVRRTPFLHSVPAPQPRRGARIVEGGVSRMQRRISRAPLILLYHRIAADGRDPLGLAVSPANFAAQLEVLAARRTIVALDEVVAGEAPPGSAAITFDDGYADVLLSGLPALEAAAAPFAVFVSTGHVGDGAAFWWDAVDRLLVAAPADAGILRIAIGDDQRAWPAVERDQRDAAARHLRQWLQGMTAADVERALLQLGAWAGVGDPIVPPDADRPMTVDELGLLAASELVTIGSHARRHTSLATRPEEELADELASSRADIARWLGRPPDGIAYPFGVPGVDVTAQTVAAARDAGYRYGLVNVPGRVGPASDRLALARHAPADVPADAFDAWLTGAAGCRARISIG